MVHTILLVQSGSCPTTRTYTDYNSLEECLQGICTIYENYLKLRNPEVPIITYNVSHLFDFFDQLFDISCLIYQSVTKSYAPYNKDWIKEKIYIVLQTEANRTAKDSEF